MPPNLTDLWPELVEAGATDLGGLSANGDHISPEEPFPSPHQVRKELAPRGYALTERLCAYPSTWIRSGWSRGCSTWSSSTAGASSRAGVRAGDQESPPAPEVAPRAIEKGRRGEELSEAELRQAFATPEKHKRRDQVDAVSDKVMKELLAPTQTPTSA